MLAKTEVDLDLKLKLNGKRLNTINLISTLK